MVASANKSVHKRRPKVLCLGMSFPDLEAHLNVGQSVTTLANVVTPPSTDIAVRPTAPATPKLDAVLEAVQRGILTQMDGRDLARCLATEERCQVDVYGVSQEKGAIYRADRHLDANFNRASFVQTLQKHFVGCQFDQIILDYFWIPAGWDTVHWRRPFFETTLVDFAKSSLLRSGPSRVASGEHAPEPTPTTSHFNRVYRRGIYLPFCFHCFKAIVSHSTELKQHFNISFIRKHELKCLTLWSGTQQIGDRSMQHTLGKRIDQEEVYCTFGPRHLKEMDTGDSTIKELAHLATSLEDFADIRFILLEPLRAVAAASAAGSGSRGSARQREMQRTKTRKPTGRFLGLVHPHMVQRGFRYIDAMVFTSSSLLPSPTHRALGLTGTPPRRQLQSSSLTATESSSSRSRRYKRKSIADATTDCPNGQDSVDQNAKAASSPRSRMSVRHYKLRHPSPSSVIPFVAASSNEDNKVGTTVGSTKRFRKEHETVDDEGMASSPRKALFS